jgi:hypothetical protein
MKLSQRPSSCYSGLVSYQPSLTSWFGWRVKHVNINPPIISKEIESALSFIPANDREIWLKCGMAIKSELGENGFDEWSN